MMWCVHAEQVVAAVVGGSEHGLVAGPCKDPSGLDQKRQRQRGAIGIENHPGAVAPLQELRNCINEAVPQSRVAGCLRLTLSCQSVGWRRSLLIYGFAVPYFTVPNLGRHTLSRLLPVPMSGWHPT